jgi:hypothetical protein
VIVEGILCFELPSTSTQQRALRAAANPFSVLVNVAVSTVSRVVAVIDIFDEVCFSTDVQDEALAQKWFCGCILWPIFRSDVADVNNFRYQ